MNFSMSVEHSAQPASPGAIRSSTVAPSVIPPELSDATSLLVQPPVNPGRLRWTWANSRRLFDAPTLITVGSPAGLPTVPKTPASPLATTTLMPAATAAWLASEIGSSCRSGTGLLPNDSLSTSTLATVTA